ncbi:hypothetical protein Glove_139g167 [Diversispora epigaea]|uniref:Uncharacterized protein n=1 Tax=Diversispora epigaea TaxID=1348612 RepID=A0A397IZD7_9GLOM|nr:hypothetical protein Glove_139g167 [Diversispora epigaea]
MHNSISSHHYTPQDEIDKGMFLQLVDLWDKCLIYQCERVEFFKSLQKIESADEVYELLSQKMIESEKKGIRPTSFFQSSFRRLEEENLVGPIWLRKFIV